MEFVSAGVAAAVELSLMQPLDLVKTRMQLAGAGTNAERFSGTVGAARSIARAEGLAGLYRGFGTGLAIVVPRRGFKFAANEFFRSQLGSQRGGGPLSFRRSLLAGGLAGNPNPDPGPDPTLTLT